MLSDFGNELTQNSSGRGGRPAAPATVRVYVSMIRALARELDPADEIAAVRIPPPRARATRDPDRHRLRNLLRVADRRTQAGKRDCALLRVLGDCGLRSAALRGLRARDLRRPRSDARYDRLYIHAKRGGEREVPVPQ